MSRQNSTRPDAAGGSSGSPIFAAGSKLLSNHGNLLLPVLFVLGVLSVYLLGLGMGPRQASAGEQQDEMRVESALNRLDQFTAHEGEDARQVVQSFYTDTERRQVPIDRLTGNPYVFHVNEATEDRPDAGNYGGDRPHDGGAGALREAIRAAKRLNLQSVLTGPSGSKALISDNLLSEGQTVAGWTVSEIRPRSVVLTWKGHRFVLKLPQ